MKTEIETYLEILKKSDVLDKNDTFILEVKDTGNGTEKILDFYKKIYYEKIGISDRVNYFNFKSKKIDKKAIADLEQGLLNLGAKGYKINYNNTSKDGQV